MHTTYICIGICSYDTAEQLSYSLQSYIRVYININIHIYLVFYFKYFFLIKLGGQRFTITNITTSFISTQCKTELFITKVYTLQFVAIFSMCDSAIDVSEMENDELDVLCHWMDSDHSSPDGCHQHVVTRMSGCLLLILLGHTLHVQLLRRAIYQTSAYASVPP